MSMEAARPQRLYERLLEWSADRLGDQGIPSLAAIDESIDKQVRLGASDAEATRAVVEDFEQAAAALTARTAPFVPASGLVVAATGLLAPLSDAAEALVFNGMFFAALGLVFITASLFTYTGRRFIGLPPSREDVAFARRRLIYKAGNATIGTALFGLALVVLITAILTV